MLTYYLVHEAENLNTIVARRTVAKRRLPKLHMGVRFHFTRLKALSQ